MRTTLGRRSGLRLGLTALALIGAGLAGPARAQEVIPALGTADAQRGTAAAIERLARELMEMTQGRARIEVAAEAADGAAVLAALQRGEVTLGWVRVAETAALSPEIATLTVPFLFRDQAKALGLLEATWLGPLLEGRLLRHGLQPLGFMNAGALRLAGEAAPALPAAGGQVTARPGALRAAAFAALGLELVAAVPSPGQPPATPLVELRTDDLAALALSGGGARLAVVEAPHAHDLVVVLANRQRFDDLPLDLRETMRTRVQETATWQRGATAEAETLALAGLRQGGGELVALSEDQVLEAHERVRAAVAAATREAADPSIMSTLLTYAE